MLISIQAHIIKFLMFSHASLAGNGLICTFPVKVLTLSYMTFKLVAGHLLNHPSSGALTVIVVVLSGSSPTLDTHTTEEWDNLRTLFMHFISINVLLAQDQKDWGNLNFLMKVISSSFILILRVIRLCTIRERTWESSLWGKMSNPSEEEES